MAQLRILACQIDIPAFTTKDKQHHHLQYCAVKANAWLKEHPADILLLPELSSLTYANETFAQLDSLAEEDEGISFQTWSEVASNNNCWVVYGFARRHNTEKHSTAYSIATGLINPNGQLKGIYEKLHLAQFGASEEKDYFSVSGNKLVVFEHKGFRLSPITCYDIRFPELSRTLVLQHQVDCILHTGAYARDPSFDSWHAFVKTRAMENQVYVASLNRAGTDFGASVFMPPWSDADHPTIDFAETQEECRLLTLDRGAIDSARQEYHFLDDRLQSYDFPATQV